MSSTWKAFGLLLGGVCCILLSAVLIVFFLRSGGDPATKARDRRSHMAELELQQVLAARREILQLRAQIDEVKAALANSPKNRRSIDIQENVEAALERLSGALTKNDSMLEHLEQEDYVATTGSQIAAQNLSTAEVVIGGLSVAFAVVLFGATILTALNLHSYKEDADKKATALETQFGMLQRRGQTLLRRGQVTARESLNAIDAAKDATLNALAQSMATITQLSTSQEQTSRKITERLEEQIEAESRTREFLGKIADLQGSAFTELIGAFPLDPAHPEAKERLLNKSLELQARMDLAHPEPKRLWAAIATLAKLGTKAAIPDLGRLRDKKTTETSLAFHADRAIREIQKRHHPAEEKS